MEAVIENIEYRINGLITEEMFKKIEKEFYKIQDKLGATLNEEYRLNLDMAVSYISFNIEDRAEFAGQYRLDTAINRILRDL